METIFLSPAPMPYLTDCKLKRFGINEYHCSRCCGYFVLIFMLKNTLQFTENGLLTTLHPGEWYIQRKNIRQDASRPSPKAEYYYVHFEAAYTEDRTNRLMLPVRGTFQPGLFLPLLQQLERLLNRTPCSHLELQSEFFRLLGLLYTQEQSYTPLTASLMRYLNENYASHITGESLAEAFHYSSEYIDKKMKQELGMTPHAYLTCIRLQNAKKLLERTDLPIQKIALECGFSDNSIFYKAFKKSFSLSPSEWRKKNKIPDRRADTVSSS